MDITDDKAALQSSPSLFVESVLGVEPFGYQKQFLDADARHRVVSSGRQVGKSRMAAWIALHHAMTNAHEQVLITAPSLRQSSLLFDTLYSEIEQSGITDDAWGIDRSTQTIIEFDNGTDIHCVPTGRNGNKIRGYTSDLIIVDEAAFIQDSIFEESLEPMTFATGGSLVLASTPYGMSGYFYRKFSAADGNSSWFKLQVGSDANPLIDGDDLEEFKTGKTEAQISREVYGEFVADAGQFFPVDAILGCMDGGQPARATDYTVLGADIAGSGTDRTVFHGADSAGNVFLNDEAHDQMGPLEAADYIGTLDRQYNFDVINVDRTAIGEGTIEKLTEDRQLERKINPVYFTVQKKQQIYQRLKAALQAGFLHLPHDTTLRSELESMSADQTKNGNLSISAESGENASGRDDYVDSLALAVWGLPEFGNANDSHIDRDPRPVFESDIPSQSSTSTGVVGTSARPSRNRHAHTAVNTRHQRRQQRRR